MAWDRRKTDAPPWELRNNSFSSSTGERPRRRSVLRPSTAPCLALLACSTTAKSTSTTSTTSTISTTSTSSRLPLSVRLTVRFADPAIGTTHFREYDCSSAFQPTDKICRGLLHRIGYCSEELITRNDPSALGSRPREGQPPKQLRYEISYRIFRRGILWAERTFKSYQKQPFTPEHATTVLLAGHKIVGLYLRYHDDAFKWTAEPKSLTREACNERPITPNPKIGTPLPLSCVPSPHFNESTQDYDSNPGFSVELTFNSRSRARKHCDWTRAVKLNSTQESPLNLPLAEELYWRVSKAVTGSLDAEKEAFFTEHAKCEFLEGTVGCQHFGEDALEIEVAVTNHLGPAFDHLRQRIRTRLGLFRHPDALDCQRFLRDVHEQLVQARDRADSRINQTPDLDFAILELQGKAWSADNAARVSLDSHVTYSRRTTQAILDRLQAGVADVLRGHNVGVHYAAHKRGHLVLDKAVIARANKAKGHETFATPEGERDEFVARLRLRMRQDLERITRDTFSVDAIPDDDEEVSAWTITGMPEDRTAADQVTRGDAMDSSPPSSQSRPRVFPLIPQRYSSRGSTEVSWASADMGTPRPQTAPLSAFMSKSDHSEDGEAPDVPERRKLLSSPRSQELSLEGSPAEDSQASTAGDAVQAADDDKTSSQLSTPGLTNGTGSSPRNSLLITPTLLGTQSGAEIAPCAEPHLVPDDADDRELCNPEAATPVHADYSNNMTPIGTVKALTSTEVADQSPPRAAAWCPGDTVADLRGDEGAASCETAESAQQADISVPITEADKPFEDFSRSKPDLEFEADDDSGPDALSSDADCVSNLEIDVPSVPYSVPEDIPPVEEKSQNQPVDASRSYFGSGQGVPVTKCIEDGASVSCGYDDVTEGIEPAENETVGSQIPSVASGGRPGIIEEEPVEIKLLRDGSADAQSENHDGGQPAEPQPENTRTRAPSRSVSGSTIVDVPDPAEVSLSDTIDDLRSPLAPFATLGAEHAPRLTETEPPSAWQDYESDCDAEGADDDFSEPRDMDIGLKALIVRSSVDADADDDLRDDLPDDETVRPQAPGRRYTLPTLGILGFQETKVFEMGLRGALVGSRRFDAPAPATSPAVAFHVPEPAVPTASSDAELSPPQRPAPLRRRARSSAGSKSALVLLPPSSPRSRRQKKGHRQGRSLSSSTGAAVAHNDSALRRKRSPVANGVAQLNREETDVMLPRVVMMFAGMAIASQMINNAN